MGMVDWELVSIEELALAVARRSGEEVKEDEEVVPVGREVSAALLI